MDGEWEMTEMGEAVQRGGDEGDDGVEGGDMVGLMDAR